MDLEHDLPLYANQISPYYDDQQQQQQPPPQSQPPPAARTSQRSLHRLSQVAPPQHLQQDQNTSALSRSGSLSDQRTPMYQHTPTNESLYPDFRRAYTQQQAPAAPPPAMQPTSSSASSRQDRYAPPSPSLGPFSPQERTRASAYSPSNAYSPNPPLPLHRSPSQSQPNSPLHYASLRNPSPQYYPLSNPDPQPMIVEPPPKRRDAGFRRIRGPQDLRPIVNPRQPVGRRFDASAGGEGSFLSPLRALTTHLPATFNICNPSFAYESHHNPRRVLTKPSKPVHNDGYDNEDYDYILYVNDWLGSEESGAKYLILDVLGQGTFGQVVKCQNMKTHEIVAVKVVKNKPAYFNQSMMEVTILELLNNQHDPHDTRHILRLRDSFIHKNHLCLVFELLASNLYELIKQNQFHGLSTQLVKVFAEQLLDALCVLKDARLIHCDLKPENILLKRLDSPTIKVIDFGSACHEKQTVYTYIQSRFYRSPEVLLGVGYTAAIDMWSLGCIVVELFLGLPIFPGTSEYNQITRIVEMLGMPPQYHLEMGKQTNQFFDSYVDGYGHKKYRLKSLETYSREHNTNEQPGKQYFKATTLPDIVNGAAMPSFRSPNGKQSGELDKELNNRAAFIDFCQGLLNLNPLERWTPQQARLHPFITGEPFVKPFVPPGAGSSSSVSGMSSPTSSSGPPANPKQPYGGLVPSQPKGTRAYQDAATYNQHLQQHQAYTTQAQLASQATNNAIRNPYGPPTTQGSSSSYSQASSSQHQSNLDDGGMDMSYISSPSQQRPPPSQITHSQQQASLSYGNTSALPPNMQPNPPSSSYYPNSRARANTINQMDAVPPALARLQHMSRDITGIGRNTLTPIVNREEMMREWERRATGGQGAAKPPPNPYPQLEFLEQQARMPSSNWSQPVQSRYAPQHSSNLAYSSTNTDVDVRRDAVLSNVRSAAGRNDPSVAMTSGTSMLASPPQAYTAGSGSRYNPPYPSTSSTQASYGGTDVNTLYMPMQPHQFQTYTPNSPSTTQGPSSGGLSSQHPSSMQPSFYGSGVVPSGQSVNNNLQHRNAYPPPSSNQPSPNPGGSDSRRHSGMDIWSR